MMRNTAHEINRVLVTGGSGFIGSRVVELLLQRGFSVSSYDAKPPIFRDHAPYWFEGDVRDRDRLDACFSTFAPDAVLHLAAKADIAATVWDDYDSIHLGTARLLEAIDRYGKLNRLVNISTQLVIGPTYRPRSLLDYRPYTMYGEAKAYAESLLLQWRSAVHWLTVRPANVWGPHHPSLAQAILKQIANGFYVHPATKTPVLRGYGYVRNTAAQIVSLMQSDPAVTDRQTYYAADEVIDFSLWVDAFSEALTGKKAKRIFVPALRAMGLLGDLAAAAGRRIPIDSQRVMRMTMSYPVPLEQTLALCGAPQISFDEGVAETMEWLGSLGGAYAKSHRQMPA